MSEMQTMAEQANQPITVTLGAAEARLAGEALWTLVREHEEMIGRDRLIAAANALHTAGWAATDR